MKHTTVYEVGFTSVVKRFIPEIIGLYLLLWLVS